MLKIDIKKIAACVISLILSSVFCSFGNCQEKFVSVAGMNESSVIATLYEKSRIYRASQEPLKAKTVLKRISFLIKEELEELNLSIIQSDAQTAETVIHEIQSGDTLGKIAQKYQTTVELIKKRNNLADDVIKPGQSLSIWAGIFNIVIEKSTNILWLMSNDKIVKSYLVSTGKEDSTPVGDFTIVERLVDPVWYHDGEVVQPGPDNWLGKRWLGFDKKGYGIHGTVQPHLIGTSVSSGCIRMKNEDVEELFPLIPRGTKVSIIE